MPISVGFRQSMVTVIRIAMDSRASMSIVSNFVGILLFTALVSGCVQNAPYRTAGLVERCSYDPQPCESALIEQYLEFDLAFVEFTQRGNIYDRARSEQVLKHVEDMAQSATGAAVFVFAHGWKHDAAADDSNVVAFREFLSRAAENPFVGSRRVIGVYLGWRGGVTTLPLLKELSYWGRKSVAEEVGSGGATEVISELKYSLVEQFREIDGSPNRLYKNTYVVIGHSFGGAIVLTALHDILLTDLIAANGERRKLSAEQCNKVNRFADGIILINPAIEANRAILLREAAAKCTFKNDQAPLLHVLSSEADTATSRYFPLGQRINLTSTLSPKKLLRTINNKQVTLSEHELDINTVGNYAPLRTGYLFRDTDAEKWRYQRCGNNPKGCGINRPSLQRNHISTKENDPLVFLRTDQNFIKDHNDAFSCYVQAYITSAMFQSQAIDSGFSQATADEAENIDESSTNCQSRNFEFDRCFNNQLYDYNCELQDF